MRKFSKKEAEKEINKFFSDIKSKTPEEIRKIKKLSMRYNLKLGELRRKFCRNCFSPLKGEIRIKKGTKSVECENCGYIIRWRLK